MSRAPLLSIEPERPNPRPLQQAVGALEQGGVIIYPTDSVYGIGCDIANRRAVDRIYRIKRMERDHLLSFICPDLATIARYAQVDDFAFRWLRRLLPGPYTVIL